jgi:NADPH2:quinone reductase
MPTSSVSLPAQWERLAADVARGALAPVIHEVVDFDQAAEAVAALDERRALGKTVIAIRPRA